MSRNWEALGINWLEEEVYRKDGNTKVLVTGKAQIPQLVNLAAAIEHFGENTLLASINGTSWRVSAQAVNRDLLPTKADSESIREAVYNRISGTRRAAVVRTKEVKVYTLANGAEFRPDSSKSDDENLTSLQAAALAAYFDVGVPNDVARTIVAQMSL